MDTDCLSTETTPSRTASFGVQVPESAVGAPALPQHVHLLGAGGAGVSGIGRLLLGHGVRVTGHDRAESQLLQGLEQLGVELQLGDPAHHRLPEGVDCVVRSAAVPEDDPLVVEARARGVRVLKYAEALNLVLPRKRTLAVAGTHGKTTVSWMLWHALEGIGDELGGPVSGALVGGTCRRLDTNALQGSSGGWFCVEACEYDRSFLNLSPFGAIVTNVEGDHLDYYGTIDALQGAFARFVDRIDADGLLVVGADVPEDVEHAAEAEAWRLGRELFVDLVGEERGLFRFRLRGPGWATPAVTLQVPGHFNVENAALAIALAVGLTQRAGADPMRAARGAALGVERYLGAGRRFDLWGSVGEIHVVHDYAHHPTEVRVTLEAARRVYPGVPLHVLFQPHQHSRTSRFLEDFAESLRSADHVVVADVYGARTHIDGQRHAGARELCLELRKRRVQAVEGGPLDSAVRTFADALPSRACALVLGAGDVDSIREDLLAELALRSAPASEPRT